MPATTGTDGARALAAVDLLKDVPPGVLDRLADRTTRRQWSAGELLVEQGSPGGSLLVLVQGAAIVYRTTGDGSRAALAHLAAPASLGEVTLLDGGPRSATVEAVEPTEAIELHRSDLLGLLQTEPAVLEGLLTSLARLVCRLSDQTADHLLLDVGARVAKTLVALADASGGPAVVRLSQSRMAELAGGSRQTLNQVLRTFEGRGYLRREGRTIVVEDVQALRRRAGLRDDGAGLTV